MWTSSMRAVVVLLVLLYSSNVNAHNFKQVVRQTIDSVCLVESEPGVMVIDSKGPKLEKGPFDRFLEDQLFIPQQDIKAGSGSCFVILFNKRKYLITNDHVVSNSGPNATIYIFFKDDLKQHEAKLIGTDKLSDIAVLEMKTTEGQRKINNITPLEFADSDTVSQGEEVIAIGHPIGMRWTVTQGIVSAVKKRMQNTWQEVIQTDVSINPGNSGGPLLNFYGKVVGINSFIMSPGAGGSIGINFSVTSNKAISIIKELVANGQIKRGKLGIAFEVDKTTGLVLIKGLEKDGAMELAGFEKGDILQKINGVEIHTPSDIGISMDNVKPSQKVDIQVLRGDEIILKTIITHELLIEMKIPLD